MAQKRPPVGKSETPLRRWMQKEQKTFRWMMLQLGVRLADTQDIIAGRQLPTLIQAFRIQQITRGAVPPSAWLDTSLGQQMWHSAPDQAEREARARQVAAEVKRNTEALIERNTEKAKASARYRAAKARAKAKRERGEGHPVRAEEGVPVESPAPAPDAAG